MTAKRYNSANPIYKSRNIIYFGPTDFYFGFLVTFSMQVNCKRLSLMKL